MRPTSFKRGGGFLNGVDAMITGYQIVVGEPTEIKKGTRKGEIFTPLTLVPTFRSDGADEDVSQRLLIGEATNFGEVSEDGLSLAIGDGRLSATCEAAVFINSLCENGFPANNFDEDETVLNLEPMIGTRVRLIQVVNDDKTKRQGQQKGKDGKLYDRKDLKVEQVLDLPTAKSKPNGAAKTPAKVAAKGKAAKGPDVPGLASETLIEVLKENGNSVSFSKLKMKVFGKFGAKHPNRDLRDEVLKYLGDSTNIDGLGDGVEFDGKSQTITLSE